MSRGMTLLETVVALALTASLATAILGWTTGLQRLAVRTSAETAWADAAAWSMARIEEDLRSGVRVPPDNAQTDEPPIPRLEVSDDRLLIRPNAFEPEVIVVYALDRDTGDLVRIESGATRRLLGRVGSLRFDVIGLEEESPETEAEDVLVRAALLGQDGKSFGRAYRVGRAEVRP